MKRHVWMVWLAVLKAVFVVAAAFATGGADEAADDTADNVFLGERDLAERMEIWRNQYRRMTPGDAPLVQDVGTWPAAWEEFSHAWAVTPAERDLATWLVPVVSERTGALTVLHDADGNALWSGATDFAKEGSESVTLTGALVSEEDWALWQAARAEIDRRLGLASPPRLRDGEGGVGGTNADFKMFVSASACLTNDPPELRVGLQWTNDVIMDVFAYGPLHVAETNTVTYTNDENQVITTNVVDWHSVEPGLTGRYDNLWEHVGTVALTNGDEVVFVDTNFLPERSVVRFYAAFAQGDADNDGLNDAFETQILNTSTNSADSDGDGIPDGVEYAASSNPSVSNIWWVTKTTNEYFKVFNRGDCSPPHTPQDVTSQPVVANPPSANSVVADVTITGFVDDAIRVDGNGVDFGPDTQRFNMRHITNEIAELQSGQFTLTLVDYPRPDYSGPNEAKLGWSDSDKFSVEWTWRVPIETRMEPILGGGACPLDNPCGLASNDTAWFHVEVWPDGVVPETNVVWTSVYQKLEFATTNRGTRVQVRGRNLGADELRVALDGTIGDCELPPFHVKVMAPTVVTAKVGVVTTATTVWADQMQRVSSIIASANDILAQAGMSIAIDGTPVPIPDLAGGGYYELDENSTHFTELFQELAATGVVKLYFVGNLVDDSGYDPGGVDTNLGMALDETATGVTLAHEVLHRCGLEDIFSAHPFDSSWVVEGETAEARLPMDWGCYRVGNEQPLPQAALISRLLMHGFTGPDSTDIPSDAVWGIWKEGNIGETEWDESLAPVGLEDMVETPQHD